MTKKRIIILSFLIFYGYGLAQSLAINVEAVHHEKMKLLLGVIDAQGCLSEVASYIKKDIEFSGQFDVVITSFNCVHTKHAIKKLFGQGFPLALFVNHIDDGKAIEWRLYDTIHATMIRGKKYTKRGTVVRGWAHNIADMILPELTGQEGYFSTKIAYCKETGTARIKHIYIADYDGSHEQLLVNTSTVNVAPRWNRDMSNPLLFYSECTSENIRLMLINMKRQRYVASNFDGLNMLPSFSKDGTKVVYCASRGNGSCQLYYYEKGIFRKLTHRGNNVSPTLSDDGSKVFLCSDFKTGRPHIYCYDLKTNEMTSIVDDGYCVSPSYSEKNNKIAYVKRVNRIMQIFLYDMVTHEHAQLTFNNGNKEECSWSPCGNYLIFSVTDNGTSKIAMMSLLTNEYRILTAQGNCSYPSWSPTYNQFPAID